MSKETQVPRCEIDILEGRNLKHLDSGLYGRGILEDSVTGIFLLVHDGPGH